MRVCVLHPSYELSSSAFKDHDPAADPARFLPELSWTHVFLHKATAARELQRLAHAGHDVFLNLCDGSWDEDRAGIEVVQTLERLGLPFTGPASDFYDPTRLEMKLAASYAGVAVPAFAFVHDAAHLEEAAALRYPLIVKHPASYSSIGLTPASRVTDEAALRVEVQRMVGEHGGALVEEFIAGREFTVLVTEPRATDEDAWALVPFECHLGAADAFKHFDLKWRDHTEIRWSRVEEPAIDAALRAASRAVFVGLGGSGYARCDFRMDTSGRLFFLEINPMCGLLYPEGSYGSGDFIAAAEPGGHAAFLRHQLERALARHARNRPALEIRHSATGGFGLHTLRAFAAGERIEGLEEGPQHLVSRRHVERSWTGIKRTWFAQYAFPLTDRVFGMWSERPADWRPYNHSCEPSAQLDGLDVVTRRPIEKGEAVTLDYMTFTGPESAPFDCACGSRRCRGRVTGWDHLTAAVEPYGDAVSDYVAEARRRLAALGAEVVQRTDGQMVLRSRTGHRAGTTLVALDGIPAERSRYTIQIDRERHLLLLPAALRLLSHSCRPNLHFALASGRVQVFRDVAPGEELSYFYPSTEWEMAEPFACGCGQLECLGQIRGARHLERERLRSYALTPHIRALAELPEPSEPELGLA